MTSFEEKILMKNVGVEKQNDGFPINNVGNDRVRMKG